MQQTTSQLQFPLPFEFFKYTSKLKELKRAGWLRFPEIPADKIETVSSHCFRTALFSSLLLCTQQEYQQLDLNKCILMGLIHDIAESIIGDITPYDGVSKEDKQKKEEEGFKKICESLPDELSKYYIELWQEFEEDKTKEAQLVKDMDIFERISQAFDYEEHYNVDLSEFFKDVKQIRHPQLIAWANEILQKRENRVKK